MHLCDQISRWLWYLPLFCARLYVAIEKGKFPVFLRKISIAYESMGRKAAYAASSCLGWKISPKMGSQVLEWLGSPSNGKNFNKGGIEWAIPTSARRYPHKHRKKWERGVGVLIPLLPPRFWLLLLESLYFDKVVSISPSSSFHHHPIHAFSLQW